MCRYLASRGASTTKSSPYWSPMHAAAQQGHLEVCKFLQANGASHDIWKELSYGWTPFHEAIFKRRDDVVRWLVLQGALCANGSSEKIEGGRIYPGSESDLDSGSGSSSDSDMYSEWTNIEETRQRKWNWNTMSSSCVRLVQWAKKVTESHSALVMFLLATLPPAPNKDQACILHCLSGCPGVRKHIGDFVGLEVTKGKHLRILRQVKDVLPTHIVNL